MKDEGAQSQLQRRAYRRRIWETGRVLPTRAVSLGSGLPTGGLLHRMRDFSEGEDKLQCLLLALVLLGRASLGSADGLLDALQRALRMRLLARRVRLRGDRT